METIKIKRTHIKAITIEKNQDVYDITTKTYHNFFANGILVHNCSELILGCLDSCRLMVVNLYSFVNQPFTKEASFDFEKFIKYAKITQRLMDDMIDLEAEKIQEIITKIENDPEPIYVKCRELDLWKRILQICIDGRRTGTGTTALGDALASLGLKYGSKEAIKMIDKIYMTMKHAVYEESVEMAKELGTFKGFDAEKEKKSPFIMRFKTENPELFEKMMKHGRRNVGLMTCAPCGTVSILTQTTSGIEPLFAQKYMRRRKLNDKATAFDSIDEDGTKWKNYEVIHPKTEEWMKITGEIDTNKSPWADCCAPSIDWKNRILTQATMQKHICHSISSTVNLPKDIDVQTVANIYEMAWKEGLKGITVYREGARDGILQTKNTTDDKTQKITKTHAPKRPPELPCDIFHIKVTKKLDKVRTFEYMVMVGRLNDNDPYEVFAIENGKFDPKIKTGKIIKETKGRYHLVCEGGIEIKNITKETTENEDALTRLTSTALRHGADIKFIVEQLSKVEGTELFSFAKSIARALKHYIKDGSESSEQCIKCGVKLVFENGCFVCKNCGNSACS